MAFSKPPSAASRVYHDMTNQSIARLLLAGAFGFMAVVIYSTALGVLS